MKTKATSLFLTVANIALCAFPASAHLDDNDIHWFTKPDIIPSVKTLPIATQRQGVSIETIKTPSQSVQNYRPMPPAPIPMTAQAKSLHADIEPALTVLGQVQTRSVNATIKPATLSTAAARQSRTAERAADP